MNASIKSLEIKNSFHMHTFRCQHAEGDTIDYAKAASEGGAKAIGMSDHNPMPNGWWQETRMEIGELDDYFRNIALAREAYPDLVILKAMECDYLKEYRSFYEDELLGKHHCDYLIGAVHHYQIDGEWNNVFEHVISNQALSCVTDAFIEVMRADLFDFMAHPDVFGSSFLSWNDHATSCAKAMLACAEDLQMPLEINGNGFRKNRVTLADEKTRRPFPLDNFWKIAADYKIKVLINSDAHMPERTLKYFDESFEIVQRYGLDLITDFSQYLQSKKKGIHD